MATTTAKKEIIDYIWDWADQNDDWAKLLVKKVIEKEDSLTTSERNEIYNLFLKFIGLKTDIETTDIKRPQYQKISEKVKLILLSEIEGVNKLASNQNLEFSDNITVVYGENASGKTGYSRILKGLGVCYEKETIILPNVYQNKHVNQKAKILYTKNGGESEFIWDGHNHFNENDLKNISIFTNDCVKISLNPNRELLVTPMGFHMFSLLSNELNELDNIHYNEIRKYNTENNIIDTLHEGTTAYSFISSINHKSSLEKLKDIANFSETDQKTLENLKSQLKNLNKNLIKTEIKNLRNQAREINQIVSKINEVKNTFTKEFWDGFKDKIRQLDKLEQKEKVGLKEIAEKKGIDLYESTEFQTFLKSADEYINKLELGEYPSDEKDEICIYCRQELTDQDAKDLLRNYRKLLNDNTQQEIENIKNQINQARNKIKGFSNSHTLFHTSFGENENNEPVQPQILVDYNKSIQFYQDLIEDEGQEILTSNFGIDFEKTLDELNEKSNSISEVINTKNLALESINSTETDLLEKIYELEDKKALKRKLNEVEKLMSNMGIAKTLSDNSKFFQTNQISRKTTEARSNLIAENFNKIFQEELGKLRRTNFKINLDFRTERGKSKLIQNIQSNHELTEILSEGEQKAIALAEFLTELKLDKLDSPVIFDDPVTSLDHHIIDEISRRLVSLSKERQVVIFTHNILLFNSLKQKSELHSNRQLQFKYYECQKDNKNTGILYDSPNLKEDSYKNYKSAINTILNLPKEKRESEENELAVIGYNKLRSAIEVLVEGDILQNSIKRYRKNVALTSLERINGSLIDEHKEELSSIFERCCKLIDSHSNPDPLVSKPNLEGLKIDFEKVESIRKLFLPSMS